jgi:hypothetical protein
MLKEQIFVYGEKSVIPAAAEFAKNHTIIAAGMQKTPKIAQYICVNDVDQLDQLMSNKPTDAQILAPRQLYAKYAFHTGIECLPNFEDLQPYKWDPHAVSQQLLCVAMAAWMGAEVIYLFGYDTDNNRELENLRAMITLYTNTEFVHVYKDQPKNDLKNLKNFTGLDQPQFKQRMIDHG